MRKQIVTPNQAFAISLVKDRVAVIDWILDGNPFVFAMDDDTCELDVITKPEGLCGYDGCNEPYEEKGYGSDDPGCPIHKTWLERYQ